MTTEDVAKRLYDLYRADLEDFYGASVGWDAEREHVRTRFREDAMALGSIKITQVQGPVGEVGYFKACVEGLEAALRAIVAEFQPEKFPGQSDPVLRIAQEALLGAYADARQHRPTITGTRFKCARCRCPENCVCCTPTRCGCQ